MTGNESRPDSGDAGAACPPAVSAGAGSVHRFLGAPPGRADRVAQNPSTLAAVFRSRTAVWGAGPHPGRPPAGPGCGHDAGLQRGTQRRRHATYNTANTWTHTASIPRNSEPTPAQQLPRQQPETSRPPPVRTNREHSSCFVLESRGAVGQFGKAGAMISGSRKTQCGSGPSALNLSLWTS